MTSAIDVSTQRMIDRIRSDTITVEELEELRDELIDELLDESDLLPDHSGLYTEKDIIPEESSIKKKYRFPADHFDKKVHPMFFTLSNMLAEGYSPIIQIVGREGKGKSMGAGVLVDTLHRMNVLQGEFSPEYQLVYNPYEFLLVLRKARRIGMIFEEANETLSSREHWQEMNKAVAGAIRTQRKRENCYIFVGPEYDKLDRQIREKIDFLIDFNKKQEAKVTRYHYKRGKRGNKGQSYRYTTYTSWKVPDVRPSIEREYEKVDNNYKANFVNNRLVDIISENLKELKKEKEDQETLVL